MHSIITCIKNPGSADSQYYAVGVHDDSVSAFEFRSSLLFALGEMIEPGDPVTSSTAEGQLSERIHTAVHRTVNEMLSGKPHRVGIAQADKVTASMWARINAAAALLLTKLIYCTPIVVRFHNDADGASGALGLYKALCEIASTRPSPFGYKHNITWVMQPSVSYDQHDAMADTLIANNYLSQEKPLLVMIDFGTSPESNEGIKLIEKKFDIIWLDHHPVTEQFEGRELEHYINPWLSGGDSNYTAGFLACMFAKAFADVPTSHLENASFIGDYSEYAGPDAEGKRLSILLDLITSDIEIAFGPASSNLTPSGIDKLLANRQKCDELVSYAQMRLSEVLASALTSVRVYKADHASIYVLDYEGMRVENTKYPLPGRFSSKLLDKISELNERPCIVCVHLGRYISIRSAKELGIVDVPAVIAELKERHGNYIAAGGGHKHAAGIKLADDSQKSVILKEAVSLLKRQLASY